MRRLQEEKGLGAGSREAGSRVLKCIKMIILCERQSDQIYTQWNTSCLSVRQNRCNFLSCRSPRPGLEAAIFPQISRLGQVRMGKHHKAHGSLEKEHRLIAGERGADTDVVK